MLCLLNTKLIRCTEDEDLIYHIGRLQTDLLYLGGIWHKDALNVEPLNIPAHWGPTNSQFSKALQQKKADIIGGQSLEAPDSDSSNSDTCIEGLEDHLLQLLEEVNLDDDYEGKTHHFEDPFQTSLTPRASPKKCA